MLSIDNERRDVDLVESILDRCGGVTTRNGPHITRFDPRTFVIHDFRRGRRLQSAEMSYSVYEKMGFEPIVDYHHFEAADMTG